MGKGGEIKAKYNSRKLIKKRWRQVWFKFFREDWLVMKFKKGQKLIYKGREYSTEKCKRVKNSAIRILVLENVWTS